MRVALALTPAWSTMTAPLGITSIAGATRRAGHEFRVFDLNVLCWTKLRAAHPDLWDYASYLEWENKAVFRDRTQPLVMPELKRGAAEILAFNPDIVGLSLFTTSVPSARTLARILKVLNPAIQIVIGGPAVTADDFEHELQPREFPWDYAVLGEGELTFVELLERLEKGADPRACAGIAWLDRDTGRPVLGSPRENMDLNDLPLPSFEGIDLTLYREAKLPIMMSRGCVAKCTFCSETRFWHKYRYREAQEVLGELRNDIEKYGIRDFAVADSLVNGNLRMLGDLTELLITSGTKITWNGYARIDERMNLDFLRRMARSGCTYLSYGLETGSQKIMDLMQKRTTVAAARKVIRETHAAGISVHLNIVVGFPGETEADFEETLRFLSEIKDFVSVVNTGAGLGISAGTPLSEDPERFGIKTDERGLVLLDERNQWMSADGTNTFEIRKDRLRRLHDLLDAMDHVVRFPGRRSLPSEA